MTTVLIFTMLCAFGIYHAEQDERKHIQPESVKIIWGKTVEMNLYS